MVKVGFSLRDDRPCSCSHRESLSWNRQKSPTERHCDQNCRSGVTIPDGGRNMTLVVYRDASRSGKFNWWRYALKTSN
jgi:hypothetical protein